MIGINRDSEGASIACTKLVSSKILRAVFKCSDEFDSAHINSGAMSDISGFWIAVEISVKDWIPASYTFGCVSIKTSQIYDTI